MGITLRYGVGLTVEAALSATTGTSGVWDTGVWDASTWGPDLVWSDISRYVIDLTTQRRFGRQVDSWEAGTATTRLRNEDGRFSPDNLSGPYVAAGVTGVRPWRPIRHVATWAGTDYPLYRGYALAWEEEWVSPYPGGGGAIVTVPAVDEFGKLAGYSGYAQPQSGDGEASGLRVQRILDMAGHTGTRDIDLGRYTLQGTDLAGDAVSQLKLTADSEGGAVYVGPDGTVVFDAYTSLVESPRSAGVQATFGDQPGDLPLANLASEYNGDRVNNLAAFARVGGTTQIAADNASRALYGDRQYSRADLLCDTDVQSAALAQMWVATRAAPERRITQITVTPRTDPDRLWPVVLGTQVRDLWRVRWTPPGGYAIDQLVHVAGISHQVTKDSWVSIFEFSSASPYTTYSSSKWDVGTWDSAIWYF